MPDPHATAPDRRGPTELIFKQTLMAAERTWLTWWRSALVATAGALAVGRVTPQALHVAAWPYVTLGVGYGLLAVAMTLVGAGRHRRLKRAARSASDAALDDRAVTAFHRRRHPAGAGHHRARPRPKLAGPPAMEPGSPAMPNR